MKKGRLRAPCIDASAKSNRPAAGQYFRQTIAVDVRIIAATNRNLEDMIAQGQFREDLYYRLMPPLNKHVADLSELSDYYLERYAAEMGMKNPGITADAIAALEQIEWPGNVRELANMLQKIVIFSRGMPIQRDEIVSPAKHRRALVQAAFARAGIG